MKIAERKKEDQHRVHEKVMYEFTSIDSCVKHMIKKIAKLNIQIENEQLESDVDSGNENNNETP